MGRAAIGELLALAPRDEGEIVQPGILRRQSRVMSLTTKRAIMRFIICILVGSVCGGLLGVISALFEYSILGADSGFSSAFHNISYSALKYGYGGLGWGAICGGIDYVLSIEWPKTTRLLAHMALWISISLAIFGVLIALRGWPHRQSCHCWLTVPRHFRRWP
jgi:hypothetical protein